MKRIYTIFAVFFFILLLIYSYCHTWEIDEAWTWLSVKPESFPDLFTYAHFNIANNHVLNSFWFKLMQMAGARNILFYRMLSLASYWIYVVFLYKAITYKTAPGTSAAWLILFFLPPVMVYFAIGRGYGLATALFVGSLYYMKVWLDERRSSDYWKFFFLGFLACLSIVSFLFPFVAMLLYMQLRSGDPFFGKKNIISAALLLPLVAYIYYVGRTILLHDKIINGTDHLIFNGMYSTFAGALSIYDFNFAFPDLLDHIDLVAISKGLVILSFLPVLWIMIRKRRAQVAELGVLLIMTFLFWIAHFLLKTKYPSDRSVIFIFYLLYIPVVLYIRQTGNKFFKIHYFVVLAFAFVNFFSFFYSLTQPELYAALKKKPVKQTTIWSDWPNLGDSVYNELYFDHRLHVTYIARSYQVGWNGVDDTIRSALKDRPVDYLLLQRMTYLRDRPLFQGYPVEKLESSAFKEVYLIPLK